MADTIAQLNLEISSNSKTAVSGIDALTESLNKLKSATKGGLGLNAVSKEIESISKSSNKLKSLTQATDTLVTSNKKLGISYNDVMSKIKTAYNSIRVIGQAVGKSITEINSYIENIHLFNVSMGEFAVEAKTYADQVADVMGIDPGEWMRNQGVFMTLATGFGVVGERAYTMSRNLTQLGYDISSFYNIDVADAMQKLQSGISGELEPLRRLGYDLSQAKLEATALSLGIDKAVSSMTQAEKAELRYYAVMTQVTQVQGDMAETLNQPANQLRIFKAQLVQVARAFGSIFIPILNKVLPYLTAVAKVLREILSAIALLLNFELPDVDDSAYGSSVSDTAEGLEDAAKSAKKLRDYTLGFDELNVINPDTGGSEDDLLGGGFSFELPEYNFLEGVVATKINEIVEKMKEWLGLTGEINTWADLFNTRLGKILITVGFIGTSIAAWKIGKGVYTFISSLGSLSGISSVISGIASAIGAISAPVLVVIAVIAALVAGLGAVYFTNEDVKKSVDDVMSKIKDAFVPLLTFVNEKVLPDLKKGWSDIIEVLTPFGDWLEDVFTSIWEDMLIPALEFCATDVIPDTTNAFKRLWDEVLVPFGDFLKEVLSPIIDNLSYILTLLWQNVVLPIADALGGVFKEAWDGVMKIINEVVIPQFSETIDVLRFLWNSVLLPIAKYLSDTFKPVFETVFKAIGKTIQNLGTILSGLINFIVGVFTRDWEQAWDGIKTIFDGIWSQFKTTIATSLNLALTRVERFINSVIDGWNALKSAINSLSIEIPEWLGGGTLGFNLGMSSHITLPRINEFADGGFPEQGQLFVAREAGAEMVGSIGNRTAVANNDQIVAGITNGVAEANSEQNALLREQNDLLRSLLAKETVTLDGKSLTNSVEKYQRERGRVILAGGVG